MQRFVSAMKITSLIRSLILPLTILAAANPHPARAHPHIWAELKTELVFTPEGLIKGVGILWSFDELYAQQALDGIDTNNDGDYSAAELQPLTKENLEALKDYSYFTVMRFKDQKQAHGEVELGQAENVWKDGKLSLRIFVPLKIPVDPRQGAFAVKVFDPDYYVAIDYAQENPFHTTGNPPAGCEAKLKPLPTEAELQETRDFLSSKGKDWQPPPDQEFGEMFAQALAVECSTP